jgi:hypothetical protein
MTATMRDGARAGARRRFWFDPRFAIGLLLIVASVAGVVGIVGAADSSVRLAGAERLYLVPDDLPDDGLVVTKAVAEGELVPASAVGSTEGERHTSIVVEVSGELAESVEAGSTVDVWSARESAGGVFDAPVVIVSGATVVRLVDRQGLVVDNDSRSVEVLVPRTDVARVLEAIANDDAIAVVPASLPGK